jgi:hypothetical protein
MKASIIAAAIVLTVMGAFGVSRVASRKSVATQQRNNSAQTQLESPFACATGALTPAQRKRHFEELGPSLLALRKSVHELADGYEFEFPSDPNTFQRVTEWAIQERLCCPFFDIDVHLEREGGPLWLGLTGREGTKDFIKVEGAALIKQ